MQSMGDIGLKPIRSEFSIPSEAIAGAVEMVTAGETSQDVLVNFWPRPRRSIRRTPGELGEGARSAAKPMVCFELSNPAPSAETSLAEIAAVVHRAAELYESWPAVSQNAPEQLKQAFHDLFYETMLVSVDGATPKLAAHTSAMLDAATVVGRAPGSLAMPSTSTGQGFAEQPRLKTGTNPH